MYGCQGMTLKEMNITFMSLIIHSVIKHLFSISTRRKLSAIVRRKFLALPTSLLNALCL